MDYHTIPKSDWRPYFDLVSKLSQGMRTQLEFVGEEIGDQIENEWQLFEGLSYDSPRDAVYVHVEGFDYIIHHPMEVIAQDIGTVKCVVIRDAGGLMQLIHFRSPILLDA